MSLNEPSLRLVEDQVNLVNEYGLYRNPCEWPVGGYYMTGSTRRTCGREGVGYKIALCWQHREKFNAELIAQLVASPDAAVSQILAEWIGAALSDSEPGWWTDEERRHKEKSRKIANRVAGLLFREIDIKSLPPVMREEIDNRLRQITEDALAERWSA